MTNNHKMEENSTKKSIYILNKIGIPVYTDINFDNIKKMITDDISHQN